MNQLKAGAALSYIVLFLNSLVGIAYTPYMLRMLGQSEYGLYALVSSVIAQLTIFDFGFGNAIIRYTAKFRAEGKKEKQYSMFGMFFFIYCLIALLVLFAGSILYLNVDSIFNASMTIKEISKAKIMLLIMVLNLAFTFPLSIFSSIITAYEKFVFLKSVNIIRIILNTITMIVILEIGYRAVGMVIVISIFNFSTQLTNFLYSKYKLRIKFYFSNFNWRFLKEIGIYSFYIFLNVIMDKIYWSTGQFVLGALVGTTAVAVFAVAIQLQQIYMNYSTAISGVFLPRVTLMTVNVESRDSISDLFIKTGRIQYAIMVFILTGFILFGQTFINIWAGPGYENSYLITLIIMIPLTVPLIQNLGIVILQARNEMKFRSILYLIIAVSSLIFQIPLAKRYGGVGSAMAISGALILGQIIIMNFYYYKKQSINIPKFWKEISKMTIIPIATGIIGLILMKQFTVNTLSELIAAIILFSIIYLPTFWFFGLNNYERNLLIRPLIKLFRFT